MSSPTVPGARPWNLSSDILVVVSRTAAGSILGSDESGMAGGGSAPLAAGCAAGAAGCGAGGCSRLHPAARAEQSTTVTVTRKGIDIRPFYGSLIVYRVYRSTGAYRVWRVFRLVVAARRSAAVR